MPQARDEAGNIWETDAQGNAVRLVQPAGGGEQPGQVFTLPESPKQIADRVAREAAIARQAERDAKADADRQADNARADRILAIREAKATDGGGSGKTVSAKQRADAIAAYTTANQMDALIADMEIKFKEGPGATSGVMGAADFLPTEANDRFDKAAQAVRGQVGTLLGFTGGQLNAVKEAELAVGPYLPESGNYDATALDKIARLKELANLARTRSIAILGGAPDANGRITPVADGQQAPDEPDSDDPALASVWDEQPPMDGSGGPGETAATGDTRTVRDDRLAAQVDAMINAGANEATINAVLKQQGWQPLPLGALAAARQWMKANPGKSYYGSDPTREVPLSTGQKIAGSKLGAAGIGLANAFTMGGLDEATGSINAVLNGTSYTEERDLAQGAKDASAAMSPGSYLAGSLAGGLTGGLLGGAAIGSGTRAAQALSSLPGALGAGAAYGAASGALEDNDDRSGGALIGAGLGALGGLVGKYAIAPIAERGGRLRGNAPKFAPEEKVLPDVPETVTTKLQDAQQLGVPLALADTDPALRMLAGTVTRKSANARALAESIFEPRGRGQAERAFDAIDTHLAPVSDIAERSGQWKQAAQTASAPYYAAGAQRAAPVDPRVAAFLETPAGREAVQNARTNAANDGRDPLAMGFDLDEQGEVVIRDVPSWETLDYVKRGIDQQLNKFRNPLTGKLELEGNPDAQALEGFRQRFVSTLDELNPDYQAARRAYQGEIQNRDALQRGAKVMAPQVRPRDVPRMTEGFDDRQLDEFRRGAATNMADTVNNQQLSGNPYNRVYGSTAQQLKVNELFPGASNFDRVYGLEQDMAKTLHETLGGSPTAARLQADNQLGDMLGSGLEIGADVITGGGASGLGMILNTARRYAGDAMKMGVGRAAEQRAEKIAPVLFGTDPEAALEYLLSLSARKAAMKQRKQDYGAKGALLGAIVSPTLTPGG